MDWCSSENLKSPALKPWITLASSPHWNCHQQPLDTVALYCSRCERERESSFISSYFPSLYLSLCICWLSLSLSHSLILHIEMQFGGPYTILSWFIFLGTRAEVGKRLRRWIRFLFAWPRDLFRRWWWQQGL